MKRILWALTLATLLLALVGCGAGNIYGAWQAQAMDGLVFEFEKDGGFSVRQPDDPGNVLRGSYTLVGEAGIEILLEGGGALFRHLRHRVGRAGSHPFGRAAVLLPLPGIAYKMEAASFRF